MARKRALEDVMEMVPGMVMAMDLDSSLDMENW